MTQFACTELCLLALSWSPGDKKEKVDFFRRPSTEGQCVGPLNDHPRSSYDGLLVAKPVVKPNISELGICEILPFWHKPHTGLKGTCVRHSRQKL